MCKHVLNAQVAIRSPCCRKWFDCAECHGEQETHPLAKSTEMIFACKKCKKCFRKDATEFDERCVVMLNGPGWPECTRDVALRALRRGCQVLMTAVPSDEYCPHCDNHFVIDAVTPKAALQVEGDDARIDSRMIKDDRVREHQEKSIFSFKDISDRLG